MNAISICIPYADLNRRNFRLHPKCRNGRVNAPSAIGSFFPDLELTGRSQLRDFKPLSTADVDSWLVDLSLAFYFRFPFRSSICQPVAFHLTSRCGLDSRP
ncbi:hypothetical protein Nepgr_023203 [Nepenthes gracilis]|uniref:Uncharacterized protein n=1 Tax=Nepenthes gracilis TaxID=150966 RepID=A0AAD3XZ59_NEPGR|nr:hypothetical protein Nepgr_023203 [Nepenthes gracilis]